MGLYLYCLGYITRGRMAILSGSFVFVELPECFPEYPYHFTFPPAVSERCSFPKL